MAKSELIVGLDIGTTKICTVVGEVGTDSLVDIIGIGTSPSTGLRKGVVVNIEQTVQSIKKALEEAELMAGCEIRAVYAGIAGSHIKGFNSHGVIAVAIAIERFRPEQKSGTETMNQQRCRESTISAVRFRNQGLLWQTSSLKPLRAADGRAVAVCSDQGRSHRRADGISTHADLRRFRQRLAARVVDYI